MCTRFYLDSEAPELTPFIHAVAISPLSQKFINAGHPVLTSGEIHPTNVVPTVAWGRKGKSAVFPMQFGFHLSNSLLLNARSETAGEKTTFRESWVSHRCIIPASYYFEWDAEKQKHSIHPAQGNIIYLAGLYRIETGLPHFVILTQTPSESVEHIHDRMPVILPREMVGAWIMPSENPREIVKAAIGDLIAT